MSYPCFVPELVVVLIYVDHVLTCFNKFDLSENSAPGIVANRRSQGSVCHAHEVCYTLLNAIGIGDFAAHSQAPEFRSYGRGWTWWILILSHRHLGAVNFDHPNDWSKKIHNFLELFAGKSAGANSSISTNLGYIILPATLRLAREAIIGQKTHSLADLPGSLCDEGWELWRTPYVWETLAS